MVEILVGKNNNIENWTDRAKIIPNLSLKSAIKNVQHQVHATNPTP